MTEEQWESIRADVRVLHATVIALALASPSLENVLAELQRQLQILQDAALPHPISESYLEKIESKGKALYGMLAAQL